VIEVEMHTEQRCRQVELILSDVDGVLTDGGVYFDNQGIELKRFHIRDGMGIRLWQRAGYRFGLLTARSSHIVKVRAAELNIDIVRQGFEHKLQAAKDLIDQLGLQPEQVCHIGDDLTDLPVIHHVGLGVAVQDAANDVRSVADQITSLPGGRGAVREVIETILKAKGRWDDLVRNYIS
jgi:YrbI family 3-deoxy-D-manno-octulosonate 8-phosphate phosphatase